MSPSNDPNTPEEEYGTEWYRRILEHSSDYVMVVDSMGKVDYVSPAIERVMGYSQEETIGIDAFETIHPDDLDRAADSLAETIENPEQEVTVEFRAEAKDGSILWLEARGSNLLDDSVVEGIMVNVRDITQRKEREQRVQVLNRILRHNLRNDLTAIIGHIELAMDVANEEVTRLLDSTIETTHKLLATAEKSRKVQTAFGETDFPNQNLKSVIRKVVDRIQTEFPESDVQVSVPDAVSIIASERFDDALWELLENACLHGQEPISISAESTDESVVIEITDRGPGIPDHELAVLESGEETQLMHGSGLGLWVAFWIIKASQGTLEFDAENGTTARISLMKAQE